MRAGAYNILLQFLLHNSINSLLIVIIASLQDEKLQIFILDATFTMIWHIVMITREKRKKKLVRNEISL